MHRTLTLNLLELETSEGFVPLRIAFRQGTSIAHDVYFLLKVPVQRHPFGLTKGYAGLEDWRRNWCFVNHLFPCLALILSVQRHQHASISGRNLHLRSNSPIVTSAPLLDMIGESLIPPSLSRAAYWRIHDKCLPLARIMRTPESSRYFSADTFAGLMVCGVETPSNVPSRSHATPDSLEAAALVPSALIGAAKYFSVRFASRT